MLSSRSIVRQGPRWPVVDEDRRRPNRESALRAVEPPVSRISRMRNELRNRSSSTARSAKPAIRRPHIASNRHGLASPTATGRTENHERSESQPRIERISAWHFRAFLCFLWLTSSKGGSDRRVTKSTKRHEEISTEML